MADLISMLAAAAGAAPTGEYQISRSLRFNSADSAYLARTPGTAGDRKTWTLSFWMKRSQLGGSVFQMIFSTANGASERDVLYFDDTNDEELKFFTSADSFNNTVLSTSQVFRDVSAWYHIVFAVDTTQATASNRFKLYVNGVQVTEFSTDARASIQQDTLMNTNNTIAHNIGRNAAASNLYYGGYLTDFYLIDGAALTADSFGEVNEITGVWTPIRFAGPYNVGTGVNGFHLEFADNSDVTATTLGKDTSGNGNNWTPSGSPGFSVTAGAGNDSLVDSPTRYGTDTGAGGEVRGNYCTFNSTIPALTNQATTVISNGNLDFAVTQTNGNLGAALSTIGVASGKWYFEYLVSNRGNVTAIGFINAANLSAYNGASYGIATPADGFARASSGGFQTSANNTISGLTTFTGGDVVSCAVDFDAGKIWFAVNGVWDNSGNPSAGTNQLSTFTPAGKTFLFGVQGWTNSASLNGSVNFGQRPFAYTAPSGFKALCTTNLPDPTVVQGDDYFNTVLYTGTLTGAGTQAVNGVGFQPDFLWVKNRSFTSGHVLVDAVRGYGTSSMNILASNQTVAEQSDASDPTQNPYYGNVQSLDSDGFTLGSYGVATPDLTCKTGTAYVAWNWKANGAGSSNTDGTITSTVSANTTAGISIISYTGTGSVATVGHGLSSAPEMVLFKARSSAIGWDVYHTSVGNTAALALNSTGAAYTSSTFFNNTSPSSTVITLGTDANLNGSGTTFIAYAFHSVKGFSKFGSYTGNGSTDGPFVYTGFRPAFVLVKNVSAAADWGVYDDKRNVYNQTNLFLEPNSSDAEGTSGREIDMLSNGFKVRSTSTRTNTSSETYIFACFASNPFKLSLAR